MSDDFFTHVILLQDDKGNEDKGNEERPEELQLSSENVETAEVWTVYMRWASFTKIESL